jgi:protein-S-isoprenylcysteine O-methyltransferase Ste14
VGIRVSLRLCGLVAMVMLLAWLVRPGLVAWAQAPLPAWLRWAGAPLALAAVPLLAWTFHTLGLNLTDTVATRDNGFLVTNGPYPWVRHPFYGMVALFTAGLLLVSALWPCAVMVCAVLWLLALRTPLEEQKLIERFGDAYRDYAARTGRYLPRWSRS